MKFIRRHLPLLLAVLMLATVLPLSLTSCLDAANTIADAALEALDNYESGGIQSADRFSAVQYPAGVSACLADDQRAEHG